MIVTQGGVIYHVSVDLTYQARIKGDSYEFVQFVGNKHHDKNVVHDQRLLTKIVKDAPKDIQKVPKATKLTNKRRSNAVVTSVIDYETQTYAVIGDNSKSVIFSNYQG